MKLSKRNTILAALAVPTIAAIVRGAQAFSGSVPEMKAASEIALGFGLIGVLWVTVLLWPSAPRRGRIAQAVALLLWGALILLPTWRLGHPPEPLYDDWLGGAKRQVELTPNDSGSHRLTVSHGEARLTRPWILAVYRDGSSSRVDGVSTRRDTVRRLRLREGKTIRLVLERGSSIKIELIRPGPPRKWVLLGALLALLAFMIAELQFSRLRRGARGVATWVAATSVIFLAGLDPASDPSGKAAIGMGALAVCGGGVIAALWTTIMNRRQRASRKR